MHHFLVAAAKMDLAMPMLCRVVRMAHQRPARAVPKHLSVTQPVAPALRVAGGTRGVVMGVPGATMGLLRTSMAMGSSTAADVDPAMRRADSRHRRKRRRRLWSGLQVRRRSRWN